MIKTAGQTAYEQDVKARPRYHDGAARKAWDMLGAVERDSWERNPTPRFAETLTIGSLAEWFDFQAENADGLVLQGFWPSSALNAALRGELLIGGGAGPLFRVVIDPAVAARIKPVVDSWGQVDTASDQYV